MRVDIAGGKGVGGKGGDPSSVAVAATLAATGTQSRCTVFTARSGPSAEPIVSILVAIPIYFRLWVVSLESFYNIIIYCTAFVEKASRAVNTFHPCRDHSTGWWCHSAGAGGASQYQHLC